MNFYSFVFIISILTPGIVRAQPTVPCRRHPLPGYKFIGPHKNGDKYQDSAKRITLYVKCFARKVTAEELIEKMKSEANPKNLMGEAVYFETNTETRSRRAYVVTRKPVLLMTFETRWRNRIWLEGTEALMEKFAAKTKKAPLARRSAAPRKATAKRRK